jgi:hypothetical protein
MLQLITHRQTSRPDDEAICIGSYLGLDMAPILAAEPDERLRVLLTLLPSIPTNAIFSGGKRMTTKGFRWAPNSFIFPKGWAAKPISDWDDFDFATCNPPPGEELIVRPNCGLPWSAKESRPAYKRPLSYLHPGGLGVVAFFPGIYLAGIRCLTLSFDVYIPDMNPFTVNLNLSSDEVPAVPFDRLALIYPGHRVNAYASESFQFLLVEVTGRDWEGKTTAHHLLHMMVPISPAEPEGGYPRPRVCGYPVPAQWWIID